MRSQEKSDTDPESEIAQVELGITLLSSSIYVRIKLVNTNGPQLVARSHLDNEAPRRLLLDVGRRRGATGNGRRMHRWIVSFSIH